MSEGTKLLAVIPARGGSKGLPGKNIRPFMGIPLIVHSILFANMCPEIDRCIVSTDSDEIALLAKRYGGDVPFIRPPELALDDTPMRPVLKHALDTIESAEECHYDFVLLLDPTSPTRSPEDVAESLAKLMVNVSADGVISVSEPDFNPIWHCVVEQDGWMSDLLPQGSQFERRQEVPQVFRINGLVYIWRADYLRMPGLSWREKGKHVLYELPEARAVSIDTIDEFRRAEALVGSGVIDLPWLDSMEVR